MSLTIPPAKNYQSPLIATISRLQRTPPDGPRQVSMEFDWTTMGTLTGTQTAIYVNMANNATLRFSQIVAMKVDNSQCGADVQFVFTDTQETVLVPAYCPNAIFPVITDQVQFYAIANGVVLPNDVTRVQALNFVPPAVALDASNEQNYALVSALAVGNAAVNTTLIANTINGTLTNLQLNFCLPAGPAAISQASVFVQDGGGNFLVNSLTVAAGPNTTTPGLIILDMKNIQWRFSQGLKLFWAAPSGGWSNAGLLNSTCSYRTP